MIFVLSFVSSLGCCVNSGEDVCSTNSEKEMCEQLGGTFYNNDVTCGSVRACDNGCCLLGLDSARMIRGKCYSETQDMGLAAVNFLQTIEDCSKYVVSQEWGACIAAIGYSSKTCKFITRMQCAGEFFGDALCSEIENSNCNKTDNRVCVGNKIYYVDSCGNRDSLVEECDYNSGEVCQQKIIDGQNSVECVDASCQDNFDYTPFVVQQLYESVPIFSPIKRSQGSVWCVTNGMVPFSNEELERGLNNLGSTISGVAGLRFFSRYCVNGEIITEPCEDGKEAYCSGESNWEDEESIVGTGGRCVSNEWRECVNAENEGDCDTNQCFWFAADEIIKNADPLVIRDLEVSKCLPKVSAGDMGGGVSSDSVCSLGDFEAQFNAGVSEIITPDGKFVLLNPEVVAFLDYRCSKIADCTGKASWVGQYGRNSSGEIEYLTASEIYSEIERRKISFASGKSSGADIQQALAIYLNGTPGLEGYDLDNYPIDKFPVIFGKNKDDSLEYKCVTRKKPLSGNCDECNEEGIMCSKYICESIGQNCEYFGLNAGSGSCENKGDISPPQITVKCPDSSTIGIQQSVNISVETSETSYCRFSLADATASYDIMPYDMGKSWGVEHKTVLSVPGSNNLLLGDATQYPLLLRAGEYDLFVRCIDPKGNGDTEPAKLCSFSVPMTPDRNPPVILKFSPATNYPVLFNSAKQNVSLLVNEPVECKWSSKDQDYDLMGNSFDCGNKLIMNGDVSGYGCIAEMNNVTLSLGKSTKFYIRCKDQPQLISRSDVEEIMRGDGYTQSEINDILNGEYTNDQISDFMEVDGYSEIAIRDFLNMLANIETSTYSRNKNIQSTVYSLKPSEKLEITEISPKTKVTLGPNFDSWDLSVRTSGGGYSGITECKWKLDYRNYSGSYSAFSTTQSTFKTQRINQKTEGDYVLSVVCADDSDNIANYSGSLQIRYDKVDPVINRVYNNKGSFKIVTNEPAICKFTNSLTMGFGCSFLFSNINLTLMTGITNLEHTADYKKGVGYFVKCQDFYGNENSFCGMIAKVI